MLSKVMLIPDLNFGIVVLTNTSENGGFLFEAITNSICDSFLGIDEMDWLGIMKQACTNYVPTFDTILSQTYKKIKPEYPKEFDYSEFTGLYEDTWFGQIEIYLENNQLKFKSFRSPKLKGTLFYYRDSEFVIKWDFRNKYVDAFAKFASDENNNTMSIKLERIIPNADFSYDFQNLDLKKVD